MDKKSLFSDILEQEDTEKDIDVTTEPSPEEKPISYAPQHPAPSAPEIDPQTSDPICYTEPVQYQKGSYAPSICRVQMENTVKILSAPPCRMSVSS